MIRTILAGALLCVLLASNADARPRHHHEVISAKIAQVGCSDPVMRPCGGRLNFEPSFGHQPKPLNTMHYSGKSGHLGIAHHNTTRVSRMSPGLARVIAEGAGRVVAPARFIHGRLICALNVGAALASRGIRGTGSAIAKSYLHWGHASGPVPGAVAVFNRRGGGHVAIVHHVRPDGTVIYLNPSSRRQAWQVGPYSRKPIAYRVAGGW